MEVAQLEQRNLELIEKLRGLQTVSMEKTKEVYFASLGRKKDHQAGLQDSPGLPSLVDVSKATNDKVSKIDCVHSKLMFTKAFYFYRTHLYIIA